jgi:hypothetical protein
VFVAAHGFLLTTILNVFWRLPQYAVTAEPAAAPDMLVFGTYLGYAGLATYRCFQSHWIDGLKAALAVLWAIVEAFSVWIVLIIGYAVILSLTNPETYPLMQVEGEEATSFGLAIFAMAFVAILASLPLLLHAGVAAYARSR